MCNITDINDKSQTDHIWARSKKLKRERRSFIPFSALTVLAVSHILMGYLLQQVEKKTTMKELAYPGLTGKLRTPGGMESHISVK